MAKCRHCGRDIPSSDKDRCPYCGGLSPIEEGYKTMDATGYIDPLSGEYKLYRSKSRLTAALLSFFLGPFGVSSFYLGYLSRGIAYILITLVLVGGLGSVLCFVAGLQPLVSFLVPAIIVYLFHIGLGIYILLATGIKDGKGEFLR